MVPSNGRNDAPHVIRLLGPWEGTQCGMQNAECGIDGGDVQKPTRVKVPLDVGDWLNADYRGTATLERAFGLPTNLDDQQSVWLVLQTKQLTIDSVSLNDVNLVESADFNNSAQASSESDSNVDSSALVSHRYDIGSYLTARNRLRITLEIDAPPAGGLPHVAIEITD